MKSNSIGLFVSMFFVVTLPLQAGLRTSASYSFPADTTDLGGMKTASNSYSIETSICDLAGIATAAAPAETAKTGYIAQLYEVTGLALNAALLTVNEGGTLDGIDDRWQVDYFGQNNPQALAGANPDGDGLNNLGEWGFGLNPTVGGGGAIVVSGGLLTQRGIPDTSVTNITNGVDFRAVFGRRKDYQLFGLAYTVQFSDAGLSIWENSTATPTVIATNDPEIDAVAVPYPFLLSTGRKAQYFRVTVSHP